jgi:hypothetical protein
MNRAQRLVGDVVHPLVRLPDREHRHRDGVEHIARAHGDGRVLGGRVKEQHQVRPEMAQLVGAPEHRCIDLLPLAELLEVVHHDRQGTPGGLPPD